jgi:hypothetical protein
MTTYKSDGRKAANRFLLHVGFHRAAHYALAAIVTAENASRPTFWLKRRAPQSDV